MNFDSYLLHSADTPLIPDVTEAPNWESFRCFRHPTQKVEALCIADNDYEETKLVCIRCLCEDSSLACRKTVTIKDLMKRYEKGLKGNSSYEHTKLEGSMDRFLEFLSEKPVEKYEAHLSDQYDKVDKEITSMIDNLEKIRARYKDFYSDELAEARLAGNKIKEKISNCLETGDDFSMDWDRYNNVRTTHEFGEFLKRVYYRSPPLGTENNEISNNDEEEALRLIRQFKLKSDRLEEKTVNISFLEEIGKTIQTILKSGNILLKQQPKPVILTNNTTIQNCPVPIKTEINTPNSNMWSSLKPSVMKSYLHAPEQIITSFEPYKTESYPPSVSNRSMPFVGFKRNRARFTDIDSQALRNLKKEIDEKENCDPTMALETAKDSLYEWINRRITGYLIFQNTVLNDPSNAKDMEVSQGLGVHLNHLVGKKWKDLTKEEKEQYKEKAKDYRKVFRKYVEDAERHDDVTDLLETLDVRIKKLKRE